MHLPKLINWLMLPQGFVSLQTWIQYLYVKIWQISSCIISHDSRTIILYVKNIETSLQGHKGQFSPKSHGIRDNFHQNLIFMKMKLGWHPNKTIDSTNSEVELLYDEFGEAKLNLMKWNNSKQVNSYSRFLFSATTNYSLHENINLKIGDKFLSIDFLRSWWCRKSLLFVDVNLSTLPLRSFSLVKFWQWRRLVC
jgi:hypothetical protein